MATATDTEVRLTTVGSAGSWSAALRVGRRTVVDCGHRHVNRDSGRGAARTCGEKLTRAARDEEAAAREIADRVAAAARVRALGARLTDAEARERAVAVVEAWRVAVVSAEFHIEADWSQRRAGRTCGCCRSGRSPE
jgi:hypothetical protein